jgi:hypothetical protein
MCWRFNPSRVGRLLPFVFWAIGLSAQALLVLSAPSATPEGATATLELSLDSPPDGAPTAIQWSASSSPVGAMNVDEGPGLSSAGKTAICAKRAASQRCTIFGLNRNHIPNGVVALITIRLIPGVGTPAVTIGDLLEASVNGYAVPVGLRVLSIDATKVHGTTNHLWTECRREGPAFELDRTGPSWWNWQKV